MRKDIQDSIQALRDDDQHAVARVFFRYEGDEVSEMRGLPLSNHLENVATLARHWNFEAAFGSDQCPAETEETRWWLVEAARRHDEGKVRCFSLRDEGPTQLQYSFSGHRFDVSDPRLYVQWLIRLHHGFSVDDVTEAQARLAQSGDASLALAAHRFPLDLYALEMCDQIEAEAASRAFGKAGGQRVFMEFEIEDIHIDEQRVRMGVFPYPFSEPEVHVTLASFVVAVPPDQGQRERLPHREWLKRWLLQDGPVVRKEYKEIQLCQWR